MRPVRHLFAAFATLLVVHTAAAQARLAWSPASPSPAGRSGHQLGYDAARGVVVLFGGRLSGAGNNHSDTWVWNGTSWQAPTVLQSPPGAEWFAMTYDSKRNRLLLFGGFIQGGRSNQLWSWDGMNWTQLQPPSSPSPRTHAQMAYDPLRDRVVLFGGSNSVELGDTWEFDGSRWQQMQPSSSAPARMSHAMRYDAVSGRVLLVAGYASRSVLRDAWSWDGSSWRQEASLPSGRRDACMAVDRLRGQLVLFGGYDLRSSLSDTYIWNGSSWRQASGTGPSGRSYAGMASAAQAGEVVLFGGVAAGIQNLGDTWIWNGSSWRQASVASHGPALGIAHSVHDEKRDVILALGWNNRAGAGEQWLRSRTGWTRINPPAQLGTYRAAVAYDPVRQLVVAFGGRSSTTAETNGTWDWNGSHWTQRTVSNPPPIRQGAAMAFDRRRGRMLLFGGNEQIYLPPYYTKIAHKDDFWSSTGQDWTQVTTATRPSPRSDAAMAFDEARGETVLFGGIDGTSTQRPLGDTWIWDGSSWSQRHPKTSPPSLAGRVMVYDAARQRIVLHGGEYSFMQPQSSWEWDGREWSRLPLGTRPAARSLPIVAYDRWRGQTRLASGAMQMDDWVLRSIDLQASAHAVSGQNGGRVDFEIDAGAAHAGQIYLLLGGLGHAPRSGIPLGGKMLLLNPDIYFQLTLGLPNVWIQNSLGTLDAAGRAKASLPLPASLLTGMTGLQLYHSYVVFQNTTYGTSSPIPLRIVR